MASPGDAAGVDSISDIGRLLIDESVDSEGLDAGEMEIAEMYSDALTGVAIVGTESQRQWMLFLGTFVRLVCPEMNEPGGLASKMTRTLDAFNAYIEERASDPSYWPDYEEFDINEAYNMQAIIAMRHMLIAEYTEWGENYIRLPIPTVKFVRILYLVYRRFIGCGTLGVAFREIWEGGVPPPPYRSPRSSDNLPPYSSPQSPGINPMSRRGGPHPPPVMGNLGVHMNVAR
jgi:hypothetical protein